MNLHHRIAHYTKEGVPIVVITATDKHGEGPVEVGKKLLLTNHDDAFGTVGGGALEYEAREFAKSLFVTKKSTTKTYLLNEGNIIDDAETLPMVCGGKVTLFFEYIGPQETVYIFGGGHVGQALVRVLETMNFHTIIIDDRPEIVERFVGGDEVILSPFVGYIENQGLEDNAMVVVCTPSHKYDYSVIHKVLHDKIPVKYIGMLCSIRKLKDYLDKTYDVFGKDIDLSNLYLPIGLDLGGGSPEEIAISIASELLAVSHQKSNHKHMREMVKHDAYRYW